MPGGHMVGGGLYVAGLVVKEKVGLKLAQKLAFGKAAQKHRLVYFDVPVHHRADGALMRWGAAGGDQGGANADLWIALVLQPVQGQQWLVGGRGWE
jgi:hypothetical protein